MPVLRAASPALIAALAAGNVGYQADLFTFTLANTTVYRWTGWPVDLVVSGNTYQSGRPANGIPWLERSTWNVTNTMEVPTLEVYILDNGTGAFGTGTVSLRRQLQDGLFDGASMSLTRVFMPTPGDVTTLGTVQLFKGDVGAVTMLGAKATLKIRGKSSRLAVNAPRNVYQPGCLHTFCDAGCTLSAASFTESHQTTAGSGTAFINLLTAATALTAAQLKGGTITFTSGPNAGLPRTIQDATVSGGLLFSLHVTDPFPFVPGGADTLTVFAACDKTIATCTSPYNNLINFRGFPYIPPPNTTAAGQSQGS